MMAVVVSETPILPHSALFKKTKNLRRVPGNNRICGHVSCDDAARPDNCVFANRCVGKDGHARADGSALSDDRALDLPISFCLENAVGTCGTGVAVVDEHHPVAYKNVVLDRHALADKGVTGDLAHFADAGVLLDFDKGTNLCLVADLATVQVDKLREANIVS